jgi:hypothetical protein
LQIRAIEHIKKCWLVQECCIGPKFREKSHRRK